MTINEHLSNYAGRSVIDFDEEKGIGDPSSLYRISLSYSESEESLYWEDKLDQFLEDPKSKDAEGIVVGAWEDVGSQDSEFIVELLERHKERLPNLKILFFGDIVMEECEISWIEQGDMVPLFGAFPKLTHFAVRGSNGLSFGDQFRHENLRSLVIQCGGLGASVIAEIAAASLPALEHLELWLGEENYGADFTIDDLRPLVSDKLFPKLRSLGLKNSEVQDDIAVLVAKSPVVEKLKVLDLSMGTLTDKGAQALISSPAVQRLELLDIHHHFVSQATVSKMQALGIKVNASQMQKADKSWGQDYRFIQVSE